MRTKWQLAIAGRRWVWVLLFLSGSVGGQEVSPPGSATAPNSIGQAVADPQAKAFLMGMAKFLAQTQRFSVNIRSGYDAVQESGQKIEFGEIRKLTVSRPDRLRIEVEQSNGNKNLVLFDGKEITVFSTPQNVYAKASKPGSLDEAIAYFIQELHMRLPLALLLVSRLPAEIERRVQALDYVEKTAILGVPSHHLAGRTETVDFQIWVAEGKRPLPLRVVLTYKNEDGQPQFRAQFSDWNLTPQVTDAMFAFTPPKGAKKIAFLPQLREVAVQMKKATKHTGEQK
jgi:hypothetical protein